MMNIQTIAKTLGETGCYFICLLRLVFKENDALLLYRQALQLKIIDRDCYVKDPEKLLSLAAGGKWSVKHGNLEANGEFEIVRYERKTPAGLLAHFVVGDGKGGIAYDPLDSSFTVSLGKPVSKRLVERVSG
jgi:hypothetical protein